MMRCTSEHPNTWGANPYNAVRPPSTPPRQHYWNLSNLGDSRRSMALAVALCIATDRRCSNIAAVLCPHTCGSVLRVSCRLAAVASKSDTDSLQPPPCASILAMKSYRFPLVYR